MAGVVAVRVGARAPFLVAVPRVVQRVVALAATGALVAWYVGAVVPRYVADGEHAAGAARPARAASAAPPASSKVDVDAASVAERVQHRILPTGARGALGVASTAYRAAFDARGFTVAPSGAGALRVTLDRLTRGDHVVATSARPWRADGNRASRAFERVEERVTASSDGVEWDVVLAQRPAGDGALRVDATLRGARDVVATGDEVRVHLADGGELRIGELVVVDANGAERYRALPHVHGDHLTLDVPAGVLDTAAYPLTIDPSVGPVRTTTRVSGGSAPAGQSMPAIAFNGTNYLVVWADLRTGLSRIFATRVTPGGVILDPGGIPVSQFDNSSNPSVAWNGTNFLVAWDVNGQGILAARLDANGTVLDPAAIPLTSLGTLFEFSPAVASDGTNWYVAWTGLLGSTTDVYGTRVSAAGSVLDNHTVISNASGFQDPPAIAYNGVNYLVTWADPRAGGYDIYGARVNTSGAVLDAGGLPISTASGNQKAPALARNGSTWFVVWYDGRSATSNDIYGARVTSAGSVLDSTGIPISTVAGEQVDPSVEFIGPNFLVAWDDLRGGTHDIYAARVSSVGAVVDGSGIPVSAAANNQTAPAVALSGAGFFVVWTDGRTGAHDVVGARVDGAGTVVDAAGVVVTTVPTQKAPPAVAFDGSNYLVVWEDSRNGGSDIYGARVSTAGVLLDVNGIAISTATGAQTSPAVAWNGSTFYVVWDDTRAGGGASDIYGTRVSSAGVVATPAGTQVGATTGAYHPAITAGGSTFLATWSDFHGGASEDVYGARINTSGTVLDATRIPVSTATGRQFDPAVTWNGTNFFVAFVDTRLGVSFDIYGARVSTAGAVLDAAGIPISTAAQSEQAPGVASDGTNFFAVWENGADIVGARVSGAGAVLAPGTITVTNRPGVQGQPSVGFNGAYLVAWKDEGSLTHDIRAARVTTAGAVSDGASFAVTTNGGKEREPSVTTGSGSNWGVVYGQDTEGTSQQSVLLRVVAPK